MFLQVINVTNLPMESPLQLNLGGGSNGRWEREEVDGEGDKFLFDIRMEPHKFHVLMELP